MAKYTPMMEQYLRIKAENQDAFLFFRLGDFYEMFFDDAIKAAQELEITLTKREGGQKEPIPMCGVPYHSAKNYIKNLVDKGYKVAICEQVEDPKQAKGVVKREVIQMVTPGTVMEEEMLHDGENNYMASLSAFDHDTYVVVYNDLSTGENYVTLIEQGIDAVIHELYNQPVREIIISSQLPEDVQHMLQERLMVTLSYQDEVAFQAAYRSLYDCIDDERLVEAFSRLLHYIQHTQKKSLEHLQPAQIIQLDDYLSLDMYSKRNLELTETILKKKKYGSLLWVLDDTVTAMGSRLLKKWLERPLMNQTLIESRLDIVEAFYQGFMERDELRGILKTVYDLERLAGRIAFGNVHARDLIQLKQTLENVPLIKATLKQFNHEKINQVEAKMNYPEHIVSLLKNSIMDEPPITLKEGGVIKDGYNEQLDKYRDATRNGKRWIAELEQKEKQETNIKSLKIGYNRVFGYYIEVTKANLHLLPEGRYERKQTLTNAERYITPELKEKEQLILNAQEKSVELEYELFLHVREQLKKEIPHLQELAEMISQVDVLQAFATVSESNNYKRPNFASDQLTIKGSRHPVIEQVTKDGSFVPNDISLNRETEILLITGPNMSGKSTYMRQLALTIVMGQIGCFVPCDAADLIIFDQIFTRIGAADDLVSGQSTFMVEMLETNHAISNATSRSLILLDEIGRGTSTYDGMALAQAIVEYIHQHVHAKTLFSTHYHELTTLEDSLGRLKNIHVRAEEHNENVVFLHQINDGPADRSYGIHVAKLASLPDSLIERAGDILKKLEQGQQERIPATGVNEVTREAQLSLFTVDGVESDEKDDNRSQATTDRIVQALVDLDLFAMTPLDAMNELYRLKKLTKS